MSDWHDLDDDEPEEEEAPPAHLPAPWEQPDYGADADPPQRQRHDAFTPARRAKFLKRLAKYGCIADAARRTGVSPRTVYNHQDKDEAFARDCAHALRMSGSRMEQAAWERAVEGVDHPFACGGQVYTRKRYSDGLLRLLLQGSNPKKYGARPGFSRKRLLAWERKKIEQDIRAEIIAQQKPIEEVEAVMLRHVLAAKRRIEAEQFAAGWLRDEDGNMIPPGWVRAEDADRAASGKGTKVTEPPANP